MTAEIAIINKDAITLATYSREDQAGRPFPQDLAREAPTPGRWSEERTVLAENAQRVIG